MTFARLRAAFRPLAVVILTAVLAGAGVAQAQCEGDCNGDGSVGINELILAVNIALGSGAPADCPGLDTGGDDAVGITELIRAVNNALVGCTAVDPTATPTETVPEPTATPLPAVGPEIVLMGITAADDALVAPTSNEDGIPVYELPLGKSFHIVVEAGAGSSNISPAADTFNTDGPPSFQIQSTRALGNGSTEVCDGEAPIPGGVPAVSPPSFAPTQVIEDALNDFGCRFQNGGDGVDPTTSGRACTNVSACVRFEDGTFGCVSPSASLQYCSNVITVNEEFPVGDTLLSMRVLEDAKEARRALDREPFPGPVAQMIVRVVPPLPGRS